MDGVIIYDAQARAAGNLFGGLIALALAWSFLAFFALTLRKAAKKGQLLPSRSRKTALAQQFLAKHASPVLAVTGALCLATAVSAVRFNEKRLSAWGNQASLTGPVSLNFALAVDRPAYGKLSRLNGTDPYRERDQITVGDKAFVIECERSPDLSVGLVGGSGRCLPLHVGQRIKVDYVEIPPSSYRSEPLRITLVGQ